MDRSDILIDSVRFSQEPNSAKLKIKPKQFLTQYKQSLFLGWHWQRAGGFSYNTQPAQRTKIHVAYDCSANANPKINFT